VVCGKHSPRNELAAKGLWGAAFCSQLFLAFWINMYSLKMVGPKAFYPGIMMGSIYGLISFCLLEIIYFPGKAEGPKAVAATIVAGIPALLLGWISAGAALLLLSVLVGGGAGLIAACLLGKEIWDLSNEDVTKLESLWSLGGACGAIIGTSHAVPEGLLGAIPGALLATAVFFWSYGISRIVAMLYAPLYWVYLVKINNNKIICGTCYRYSFPLACRYDKGVRYCEHCRRPMERTSDPGLVVYAFGDYPLRNKGRIFIFRDVNCATQPYQTDVSALYIDCPTADPFLVESFVIHVREICPPREGIGSIEVIYMGDLEQLGHNTANIIRNNFKKIRNGLEEVALEHGCFKMA
jgi:hypothetical protein